MASVLQQSEPHAFVEEELVRALNEQSFGLSSYEIVSTSPLKASARVVLLEEEIIMVSLTSRGYQVSVVPRLVVYMVVSDTVVAQ